MLRYYLSREVRLHIWHSDLRAVAVSDIHDHPWDFRSDIISGVIDDTVYVAAPAPLMDHEHDMYTIQCGEHAQIVAGPDKVKLIKTATYRYRAGGSYRRSHEALHRTEFMDGTVSIITRKFRKNTENAHVVVPKGEKWVEATPRLATVEEIQLGVDRAIELLDAESVSL